MTLVLQTTKHGVTGVTAPTGTVWERRWSAFPCQLRLRVEVVMTTGYQTGLRVGRWLSSRVAATRCAVQDDPATAPVILLVRVVIIHYATSYDQGQFYSEFDTVPGH